MMRTAARNPVWAVALPLSLLARFALAWAHVPKPSLIHDAAYLGVGLVTIL